MIQAETARPITLTTPVDVNGLGDTTDDRAVINGVQTTLDQFRGTPYIQVDLRVTRPFKVGDRWQIMPFVGVLQSVQQKRSAQLQRTDHEPESVAGARRGPWRFLRPWNRGGDTVCRAAWSASDVLGRVAGHEKSRPLRAGFLIVLERVIS